MGRRGTRVPRKSNQVIAIQNISQATVDHEFGANCECGLNGSKEHYRIRDFRGFTQACALRISKLGPFPGGSHQIQCARESRTIIENYI